MSEQIAGERATVGIGRREMLQNLFGGVGAGLALPALADGHTHPMAEHAEHQTRVATADRKSKATAYKPEFLDAHQMQTLEVIAERIVPGSTSAKVAPFIDQLLAVDNDNSQRRFLSAMGGFDMHATSTFSKPWKSLTPAQQNELLTEASTAEAGGRNGKVTIRDHFDNLKGWISGAYYSSEIGMRELGWTGNMFFESLPGCTHADGHKG
jgi:Gluconate 2-dehydrogenase subunit 3